MAVTLAALKTEIARNPYAGKTDAEKAALLNDRNGTESASIPINLVTKGDFLLAIAPLTLQLATKSADVQAKWDRVISLITGSPDSIRVNSPTVQSLLALAVTDGLTTSEYVAQISNRVGSRAELLWGDGIVVTEQQVGDARNS